MSLMIVFFMEFTLVSWKFYFDIKSAGDGRQSCSYGMFGISLGVLVLFKAKVYNYYINNKVVKIRIQTIV